MKKRMSRLLSLLLISVMVISTAGVAHAQEAENPAEEAVQAEVTSEAKTEQEVTEDTPKVSEPEAVVEEPSETEDKADKAAEPEEKKEEKKDTAKFEAAKPEAAQEEEGDLELEAQVQKAIAAKGLEDMPEVEVPKKIGAKAAGSIPITIGVTGTEQAKVGAFAFGSADSLGNGRYGFSQRVSFSGKGTLVMAAGVASGDRDVSVGLYRDASMTQPVDSYFAAKVGATEASSKIFKVPAAGTYYVGGYVTSGMAINTHQVYAAAIFYNGADRTLTNGRAIAVGQKDGQTNYFAFKAVATGYVTVKASEEYTKVAICNSSKRVLSGYTYTTYAPTYGVQKGKWYYFKVESSYNSEGGYRFVVTNNKISEKSGKKKSKAVTIKKKKTKKGTILAGSKQADYYKFKLTGKKSVRIYMKGRTNDKMKITVYKGGKRVGSYTYAYYNNGRTLTLKSYGKWKKGTYYIKISRGNTKSSGWYSLKWK